MDDLEPLRNITPPPVAARTASSSNLVELICTVCGATFVWKKPSASWPFGSPTECPVCVTAREATEEAERLATMERTVTLERVARYQERGDVGERLRGLSLAQFPVAPHNQTAHRVVLEWRDAAPEDPLILVGPVGSGKTYLAACLYGDLTSDAYLRPTLWVSVPHLLHQMKRGFRDEDERSRVNDTVRWAQQAPILFLDDLGKTHRGQSVSWVEDQLYDIVDARYSNCLPTVVTTEWQAAALKDLVGESVVSRLLHGAWIAGISAPAKPYRRPRENA